MAYEALTRRIRVSVEPDYRPEHSLPEENHFFWAYHVRIENLGTETVQLRERYWQITDANGGVTEVRGAGVVGEEPVLQPGEFFEYTSGTPLPTPSGIMGGLYTMETQEGQHFDVTIPSFSLDSPHETRQLN